MYTYLVLMLFVLLSPAAFAQASGLNVQALTEVLEARPQQPLNLLVRVTNADAVARQLSPQHGLFHGWRMVIPPPELTLAPSESQVVPFTIQVPPSAPAGTYTFPVGYRGRGVDKVEALFTIVVPQVHGVEVVLLQAPDLVIEELYDLHFLVRNTGNSTQEFKLSASDNLRAALTIHSPVLHLAPGEAQELTVTVRLPTSLSKAERHRIHLIVAHATQPDVSATTQSVVELVPRQNTELAGYHTFGLRLRVSGSMDTRRLPESVEGALGGLRFELAGVGRLWEDDPGRFGIRLSNTLGFGKHSNLLTYQHPLFRLALGDQAFELSPILKASSQFGLTASGTVAVNDSVKLGGQTVLYSGVGGAHLGLRFSVSLYDTTTLSAQFLAGPHGTLLSGLVQHTPVPTVPELLHLRELELEYALHVLGGASVVRQAFRATGTFAEGPSSLTVGYRYTEAGFHGAPKDSFNFGVRSTIRLNGALGLQGAAPLILRFNYEQKAESMAGEAVTGSTSFGTSLSWRVEDVHLSIRYDQKMQQNGADGQRKQEMGFSIRHPVTAEIALQHRLGWMREARSGQDVLSYSVGSHIAVFGGRLSPHLGLELALQDAPLRKLEFGVAWSGMIGDRLNAQVSSSFRVGTADSLKVAVSGLYTLGEGRILDFSLVNQWYYLREPSLVLRLAYSLPLEVPLTRLSTVGAVQGTLLGMDGAGLANFVLRVGGMTAVTQADGSFRFPAVLEGVHYLTLAGGALMPGQLVIPALPYLVEVVAGEVHEVQLKVVQAASVQGQVRYVPPQDEEIANGNVIVGSGRGDHSQLVQGLIVELRGKSGSLRATTDRSGAFVFTDLLPGTWQLVVLRAGLPDMYRLEPAEQTLVLEAGHTANPEVKLAPVVRRVLFQDEGAVGTP